MVYEGLIKLLKVVLDWDFCKDCEIDLIYTLAWSRHVPKKK